MESMISQVVRSRVMMNPDARVRASRSGVVGSA